MFYNELWGSQHGISSYRPHRAPGITYKPAWFLTHRIGPVADDDSWECGAFAHNELLQIKFSNSERRFAVIASQRVAMTWNSRRDFTTSPRNAPEALINLPPKRGRGERRAPNAPAASCAIVVVERTRVTTSTPESPGIPARNGFNGFLRALPGDRAVLPPSLNGYVFV